MINSELLVNIGQSAFNIGQSVDDIVTMVEGIESLLAIEHKEVGL